jgi:uncharacterized protein YhaN
MIIKKIHIDGYGIFHDHTIDGFRPGINVLYGQNESGKSTLLDFIRMTLFGYERLHADRRPPLHGGNHGGSIEVLFNNASETCRLYRSGLNDGIEFHYQGEVFKQEEVWKRKLDHAESDLYNNIYGITLDELTEKDQLTKSQMKDKIFSMGLGLADVQLGEVQKNIENRAEDIYKPRGRIQVLNKLSDEIEELEGEIRVLQGTVTTFDELQRELEQLEKEKAQKAGEMQALRVKEQKAQMLERVFDRFVDFHAANNTLDGLAKWRIIPEQIVSGFEQERKAIEQEQQRQRELEDKGKKLIRDKETLEWLPVYEDEMEALTFLKENIKVCEEAQKTHRQTRQNIRDLESQQQELLTAWEGTLNRESILNLSGVKLLFNKAESGKSVIDQLKNEEDRIKDRQSDLRREKATIEAENEQLNELRDELSLKSKEERSSASEEIRKIAVELDSLIFSGADSAGAPKTILIAMLIGGLLIAILGGVLSLSHFGLNVLLLVTGLILIVLSLAQLLKSRSSGDSLEKWEALSRRQKELEDQVRAYDAYAEKLLQWEVRKRTLQEQEESLQQALDQKVELQKRENEAWNRELASTSLPSDWSPATFLSAERDISVFKELEKQLHDKRERLEQAQKTIDTFKAVIANFPMDVDEDVILRGRRIIEQLESTREKIEQKTALDRQYQDIKAQLEASQTEEKRRLIILSDWRNEYVEDEISWSEHLEWQKKWQNADRERAEARRDIEQLTGVDQFESTAEQLKGSNKLELEEQLNQIQDQVEEKDSLLTEINQQLGRIQQRCDQLLQPDDLQKKNSALESLREQMKAAQKQWLSLKLSTAVLEKAKKHFEKEKQPRVITNSRQFFKTITNGRYTGIELSLTDSDIRLETAQGQIKRVEQLSRGTREQLLLALRLGLIAEYEEQAEDLPVALDDVFVNFDAVRAESTANVLAEFSKNRQIIIFTCHSTTRELFKSYNANILEWKPDNHHPELPLHLTKEP